LRPVLGRYQWKPSGAGLEVMARHGYRIEDDARGMSVTVLSEVPPVARTPAVWGQ
jgi:hypothetical protein